jgi:hypothetical protein
MRLRLVAGRMFEPSDSAWVPRAYGTGTVNVIVSESLARQLNGQALGAKQDCTRLVDGQPINDVRSARFASRSARARRTLPRLLGRDALVAAVIGLVIGVPLSLTAGTDFVTSCSVCPRRNLLPSQSA